MSVLACVRRTLLAGVAMAAISASSAAAAVVYDFRWYTDEDMNELVGAFRYVVDEHINSSQVASVGDLATCTVDVIASTCAGAQFHPGSEPFGEDARDVVVFEYDQLIPRRGPGEPVVRRTSYHYFADGALAQNGTYDELVSEYFSRLTVSNVSAAPEPGTWALLIAGFGMTGGALRRRRAVVA